MKRIDFAKIKAILNAESCCDTCPFDKLCDTLIGESGEENDSLCTFINILGERNGIYSDLSVEMNK